MPSATSPVLPAETYWSAVARVRGLLLDKARTWIGPTEADDCVQDAALAAYTDLSLFRASLCDDYALSKWLLTYVRNACRKERERKRREESFADADEKPWRAVYEREGDAIRQDEYLHEARFRLRHANLTAREHMVFAAWLNNERQRAIAKRLGVSQPYIAQVLASAKRKLRACPCAGLKAFPLPIHAARIGSRVTIYRPCPNVGAMLWREQLERLS